MMRIKPINNPLDLTPQQRQAVFHFVQAAKDDGFWKDFQLHLFIGPQPGLDKADMELVWTWVRLYEMDGTAVEDLRGGESVSY